MAPPRSQNKAGVLLGPPCPLTSLGHRAGLCAPLSAIFSQGHLGSVLQDAPSAMSPCHALGFSQAGAGTGCLASVTRSGPRTPPLPAKSLLFLLQPQGRGQCRKSGRSGHVGKLGAGLSRVGVEATAGHQPSPPCRATFTGTLRPCLPPHSQQAPLLRPWSSGLK